jgi:hypothetical protein
MKIWDIGPNTTCPRPGDTSRCGCAIVVRLAALNTNVLEKVTQFARFTIRLGTTGGRAIHDASPNERDKENMKT